MIEIRKNVEQEVVFFQGRINLREARCIATLVSGVMLAIYGLAKKSISGVLAATGGMFLLYRGLNSECVRYDKLHESIIRPAQSRPQQNFSPMPPEDIQQGDKVTEASWESFPAVDAPAWPSA